MSRCVQTLSSKGPRKAFTAGGYFWKNPQQYGELGTAQASYDEIIKVMDLMGLKNQIVRKVE